MAAGAYYVTFGLPWLHGAAKDAAGAPEEMASTPGKVMISPASATAKRP